MEKIKTQTEKVSGRFGSAFAMMAILLAFSAANLTAQGYWPDYDFKAANADGDTLYYRITSSSAPYTVAVTRCHDSVYHTLPSPTTTWEMGQPGFLYPVFDYDSMITVPSSVSHGGVTYAVTAVDKEAFYNQKGLNTVILPPSVETVDTGAFCRSSLHNIVMPNVKYINYYAFNSTSSLMHVDLPSCLTYLGDLAFSSSALSEVEIPAGVTVLPYMAFAYCPLTRITLHEGLEVIDYEAIPPTYLDSIVFPSTLRKLALGNPYLVDPYDSTSDILCHYVEFKPNTNPLELYDYCFKDFRHLTSITLPGNTVKMGHSCFASSGIEQITIPSSIDTIPKYCFEGCTALSHVVMPQQLAFIDQGAFRETPQLREIDIPASVQSIGRNAFYTYPERGLEHVNCYSETPPSIFGNTFSKGDTIFVRVPCGKTAAYQSASGWNSYSNLVFEECVGVEEHDPADFKVYPNPADDVLFVELRGGAGIANIGLYDLQGRAVGTRFIASATGASATVNMRDIPAGVYVLRVTDMDGKEYHQKIVRK